MNKWGSAKIEVLALWPEIKEKLDAGQNISSIYKAFLNSKRLTCKSRAFYNQVNNKLKSPAGQSQADFVQLKNNSHIASDAGSLFSQSNKPSLNSKTAKAQESSPLDHLLNLPKIEFKTVKNIS